MTTQNIKRGMSFVGGISVTIEIETKQPEPGAAGSRSIDLEPITEPYRTLSMCGNSRHEWGQMQDTLRERLIAGEYDKVTTPERRATLLRLLDIWDRWHMNDARSGSRAQRRALLDHEAEHRDCHDSHRGDLYGHQCTVLRNTAPFTVWAYPEMTEAEWCDAVSGKSKRRSKVQVTARVFGTREKAEAYAAKIDPARAPEVIGVYIDRGYKFGSAWLAEPLPAEVEAELLEILDGKPARVAPDTTTPRQVSREELETEKALAELPKPPSGAPFRPVWVSTVTLPHPYMITDKSFGDGLYLNGEAPCGTCGKPASQHEQQKTLFVEVPQNKDLNAVPGLHAYLLEIKTKAEELGIQGFAFPLKKSA